MELTAQDESALLYQNFHLEIYRNWHSISYIILSTSPGFPGDVHGFSKIKHS
jgi:hypothetical protein